MEFTFRELNISHSTFDNMQFDFENSQKQIKKLEKQLLDQDTLVNEERKRNKETIVGLEVSLRIRDQHIAKLE